MTDLMLVGEAYGEKEAEVNRPFVGASGWLLNQMLSHVGLAREDCYCSNVLNLRHRQSNDVKNLCGLRAEGIPGMPELTDGKYVRKEFAPELERLYDEIRTVQPNVIVALGATAAWALLHSTGIKSIRGAVASTHPVVSDLLGRAYKVLPTYHPSMVLRDYSQRPVVTADLGKAARESAFPEVRRPVRHIWTAPTLEDLAEYERRYILPVERLACDIETVSTLITCIGFSPSPESAIVIPFFKGASGSYWPTVAEEVAAWEFVRRWAALKPCVFQNGLYDMSVTWRHHHIPFGHDPEDTMLMHHAWQPEMENGLGFLATLYTDEASWKFMRKGLKHD